MLNFADVVTSLPIESLEESLKQDANLTKIRGYGGYTALHKAALVGNHPLTLILLQYGADPNAVTNSGETCLHIACSRGSLQLVYTLLKYRADVLLSNQNGHLPIHCAAQNGSLVVVQFLHEVHGCDICVKDANGATVLHAAAAGGHLDLVNYLVKKLSCMYVDNLDNTPLHSAAYGGVSGVCWTIINNGGESLLLAKNKEGQTPLHVVQTSLSVSGDCKKWLDRWSQIYVSKGFVPTPQMDWFLLLFTPFFIFHTSLFLSMFMTPDRQWLLGLSGFFLLIFILSKQEHRMKHPSRWPNPIHVGCYGAGLLSTVLCYVTYLKAPFNLHIVIVLFTLIIYTSTIFLLFRLVQGDPGRVPPTECLKGTLIKLAENSLVGRYCSQCSRWAPPHSHHCRLCKKCFLVMDHHCLFLNTCIAEGNHWNFVVFAILNVFVTFSFLCASFQLAPVQDESFVDYIWKAFQFWLREAVWIALLAFLNLGSLVWSIFLLRYQFNVISARQTTYCRLKSGRPVVGLSAKQRLLNFISFLYNKRVSIGASNLYYEEV